MIKIVFLGIRATNSDVVSASAVGRVAGRWDHVTVPPKLVLSENFWCDMQDSCFERCEALKRYFKRNKNSKEDEEPNANSCFSVHSLETLGRLDPSHSFL